MSLDDFSLTTSGGVDWGGGFLRDLGRTWSNFCWSHYPLNGNGNHTNRSCVFGCDAFIDAQQFSNGGVWLREVFSLTSIDVQKNIMFKHTQLRWYFLKKLKSLNPPPPQKKKPTLLGTNISYPKALLKMIFLFPKLDMLVPWRVLLEGTFPTFSPLSSPFFKKS